MLLIYKKKIDITKQKHAEKTHISTLINRIGLTVDLNLLNILEIIIVEIKPDRSSAFSRNATFLFLSLV